MGGEGRNLPRGTAVAPVLNNGLMAIERLLAEGPVAKVYVERLDGAEVALKVFDGVLDRDTTAWLDRERKALDTVRDKRAILPVHDVIELPDGRTGVRMELCQGSLAGLLGARLPLRYVLAIGWTVASALATAHQVGVVHGGVTPHNVLYRRSGELTFADFGPALRRRFPRDPMRMVEYAAPETLRDDVLSEASDLYGLGAVLYAALTGTPPFPHRMGQQLSDRILRVYHDPVPPLRVPGVSPDLVELIGRLLAKDPADRPGDSAGVAESLKKMYRAIAGPVQVEFDDFAGAPQPVSAVLPVPGRTLIHTFDGAALPRRESKLPRIGLRPALVAGLGVVVAGLIVVPLLTKRDDPGPRPSTPVAAASAHSPQQAPTTGSAPNVNLVLATPADQGDTVQLAWSADVPLDFTVVVLGERLPASFMFADHAHTASIPVEPARKYCFQIRATDGTHIYQTDRTPIRGALCSS